MVDWPGSKAMFIEEMLPKARERLVTIADDVPLIQAAKLLYQRREFMTPGIPESLKV
jgi:hypothetical protein